MTNKPNRLTKEDFLKYWQGLKDNQVINPAVIPYKHEGSTYAEDSIRITGSRTFIDSVLSRIKDLLEYEGIETRLQVMYQESQDRETKESLGSWNCYIQVHERGTEGAMLQGLTGLRNRQQKMIQKAISLCIIKPIK